LGLYNPCENSNNPKLKHIIQTTTITITLDLFNRVDGGCYGSSDWVVTVEGGCGGGYGVEEFDSSQGSDCGKGCCLGVGVGLTKECKERKEETAGCLIFGSGI